MGVRVSVVCGLKIRAFLEGSLRSFGTYYTVFEHFYDFDILKNSYLKTSANNQGKESIFFMQPLN